MLLAGAVAALVLVSATGCASGSSDAGTAAPPSSESPSTTAPTAPTASDPATTKAPTTTTTSALTTGIPVFDHVVHVVFENHRQSQVIGSPDAPYLTDLATQGANFTESYAIEHPSQPNYLDMFSGGNQGITDDSCPHTVSAENIGHQLIASGRTFIAYSEGLPEAGSTVCWSGGYARKHAPWANFTNLDQATVHQPFSAFPSDFTQLPTYAWVVPDSCNDMHDCPVTTGDAWSRDNLDGYAQWAKTHNSLLIVTFDEDDFTPTNRIATVFVGDHVVPGDHDERIDHFRVLRTLQDMYGLPALGGAADRSAITDVFAGTDS